MNDWRRLNIASTMLFTGKRTRFSVVQPVIAGIPLILLAACAVSPSRPQGSSLGCVESVVAERVGKDLADKQQHCLAAGFIASYCSTTEAYLAAVGKELKDIFGPGDAEWADWRADRAGIECAAGAASDERIVSCCARYQEAINSSQK